MEFSRQEYWSGLPSPPPGDLPDAGIEPGSPALQADSLLSEPPGKPIHIHIEKIHRCWCYQNYTLAPPLNGNRLLLAKSQNEAAKKKDIYMYIYIYLYIT